MAILTLSASPDIRCPPRYPPGDLAIWVFILAELLAFGVLFVIYGLARAKNVALFDAMQLTLDRNAGALNTVLLITGSWCVARAVAAIKDSRAVISARWLAAGMLAGVGFLAVKYVEYAAKFAAGVDLDSNLFYMFYLSLTFFHMMHVVLGLVILGFVWQRTRHGAYSAAACQGMESGASYWHMVDLVWIVLFPLVYVLR